MGSLTASAGTAGDDFLMNMLTVLAGTDGLVGALFGSVGDLIGV